MMVFDVRCRPEDGEGLDCAPDNGLRDADVQAILFFLGRVTPHFEHVSIQSIVQLVGESGGAKRDAAQIARILEGASGHRESTEPARRPKPT